MYVFSLVNGFLYQCTSEIRKTHANTNEYICVLFYVLELKQNIAGLRQLTYTRRVLLLFFVVS